MSDFAGHQREPSPQEQRRLLERLLKEKAVRARGYPLSFAQERLWFFDQLVPGSPLYNMPAAVRVKGPLLIAALEWSFNELVRRHAVLRTSFSTTNGRPVQRIAPSVTLRLPVEDLSRLPEQEREAEVRRRGREEATRPFDLSRVPLLRVTLLRLADDEHVLLMTLHHIVSDGWSMGILVREIAALYSGASSGAPSPLPPLKIQYADFAHWQRKWLQGEVLQNQLSYWKDKLAGLPVLQLPADRPRSAMQTFRGASRSFVLPAGLAEQLKEMTRREGGTLFMTLLGAFQTLLFRYTGQSDVVVGSPIANRTRPEVQGLIGFFVNMLALRSDLSGRPGFRQLMGRVRKTCSGAYAHQDVPFERLVEELHPDRDLSRSPLFQVLFVLQNLPATDLKLPGGPTLSPLGLGSQTAKFDLSLSMWDRDGRIGGELEYNTDLFDARTIDRLAGHFRTLLEGIVADPSRPVDELPMLGEAERHRLLVEWNDSAAEFAEDACIHELVEVQAQRTPEAAAVVFEGRELSYGELERDSNRLAHQLRELGVGPEVLVGISMERCPEMVLGVLAVLKAGGAYVPLDPDYPRERLAFMLEDARVPVLLTQRGLLERLPEHAARVICLDGDAEREALARYPASPVSSGVRRDNLAYVIYTSGSTGRPKGTLLSHHGLCSLVRFQQRTFGLGRGQRVLQFASSSYDASVWETFMALANGATLVLAGAAELLPGAELVRVLEEQEITTVTLPPSVLSLLPAGGLDALETVVVAGEKCPGELAARWTAGRRFFNAYGPTETTVCATIQRWAEGSEGDPPIGGPIANSQVYVLDESLNPVPVGVSGELHVGGLGLARGYHERPDLTAERFIPDPYDARAGSRLYRTGDLCRWTADGAIEYLGRIDHQVKLRGIRIEPGEIEAVLAEHAEVRQALVLVREDRPGDPRLVAYVAPADGADPALGELRSYLRRKLPESMLPSAIVLLESFPLSPNGKVDRQALPAPDGARPELGQAYVAPRTAVEQQLAGIWRELLGVERVGIHDNFFELGGHSLLATQVVSRIRDAFEVDLPLRRMFEAGTVAGLAEAIQTTGCSPESPPIEPVERDGPLPLSFAQERLWFLDQLVPGLAFYNIPAAVRIRGPLDISALERSFNEIVGRHEVLRTTFSTLKGRAVQAIVPSLSLNIPVTDLSGLAEKPREAEVRRLAAAEAGRPFDLAQGPLLRIALLRLGAAEHVLLVTMHHIVSDGWSMGVFVREIGLLYEAFSEGRSSPLPELRVQYADFAHWQRRWLDGEVLERQLAYWKARLAGLTPLDLPSDRPRPAVRTFRGASRPFELPQRLSGELKSVCDQEGVTSFMVLLAAFQVVMARHSGQEDIAVGSPIANRTRAETEGLIGFFVNSLVLRTDLSGDPSFRQLLARVREMCLGAYAHQDLPFEKLVEELQPDRDLSRESLFQVMFVLQNLPPVDHRLPGGLSLSPVELEARTAKFDLTFSLSEVGGRLGGSVGYNTDLFEAETMDRLVQHFQTVLEGALAHPERRLSDLPLLGRDERRRLLLEWNDTRSEYDREACVHTLFEAQTERAPDALALAFGEECLSYAELDRRANRLGHYLRSRGVGPDSVVAVCAERSSEMVVALLGTLKAGGAYLPLDPAHPAERLAFMLDDSRAPVVLTQARLARRLPRKSRAQVLCLDTAQEILKRHDDRSPASPVSPENLAYVIYTSGSTGRPKGVEIPHAGLGNLISWHQREYAVTATDRATQLAALAFDASVWELWPYLTAGAGIYIPDDPTRSSPQRLIAWLAEQKITLAFLPTPLAEAVLEEPLPEGLALRAMLTGGDRLRRAPREGLPFRLVNHYGPTENTVVTTWGSVSPASDDQGPPPIGRPISNARVYVLDRDLNPVPLGAPGELHVGGASLARGYQRRPELTAERFIPDPFGDEPGSRLYRTGDLCRYRSDGDIEFLERVDHQVKLRGYRIELGEIEAVLASHPGVRQAAARVREDTPSEQRLVAYLVPAAEPPSVDDLRAFLREKLPDYMVPSAFVILEEFPLTPNGKLDREALPAPDSRRQTDREYVAPRTAVEEKLARIWAETLGVRRVGIRDNFFELGGHSLSAVRLMAEVQEQFSRAIPLTALFQGPTLEQLAAKLQDPAEATISSTLLPIRPGGSRRPFFCVHQDMGLALSYLPLAGRLDEDQPFYGLQAPGLYGDERPSNRIEEMASRYIESLRSVQPDGPYLLGGHSFGGYVAFEIAQQLHDQGHAVDLLALIDTTSPAARVVTADLAPKSDDAARLAHNARTIERFTGVDLLVSEARLRSLEPDQRLQYFLDKVKAAKLAAVRADGAGGGEALLEILLAGGTGLLRGSLNVSKACVAAAERYEPRPYPGRIVLLRSSEVDPALDKDKSSDPSLGWDALAAERTEVHILPGDHQSMITEPHVAALAERLQACLDRVQSDVLEKESP